MSRCCDHHSNPPGADAFNDLGLWDVNAQAHTLCALCVRIW